MCQNNCPVPALLARPGLLPLITFIVLAAAYVSVLAGLDGASRTYRLGAIACALAVAAAAALTFSARARGWLSSVTGRLPRLATMGAVVLPWLALFAVVARRGLWWTQRPVALRFFVAWLLVTWSVALCARLDAAGPRADALRRATWAVALALTALAVQGLSFGVTPFACAVCALSGAAGALAIWLATFGSRTSNLKFFASAAAALIAVLGAEATVRLLQIGHNVQEVDSREVAREFYSLTPPLSAFVNQPKALDEFGPALIEINSLGIRGPEIPEGRTDWLLIGDSMIEARQLPWDQTIGARLKDVLRARGIPLRAVSHGMRGWSPLLQWNWYLKVGRRLQPETVFLFFFWNDLWTVGDEVSTFRAVLGPDGRPDHFDVLVESDWMWYKHLRLMRLTEDVWRRMGVAQLRSAFSTLAGGSLSTSTLDTAAAQRVARGLGEPPLSESQLQAVLTKPERELDPELLALARTSLWPSLRPWPLWTEAQRRAAARTELELQRFSEDVRADGARFVLVFVPNPLQIGPGECSVGRFFDRVDAGVVLPPDSGIQSWLRIIADRHGFELLDPSEAMRAAVRADRAGPPMYLRADCHWSARGHQFMAEYLVDWHSR